MLAGHPSLVSTRRGDDVRRRAYLVMVLPGRGSAHAGSCPPDHRWRTALDTMIKVCGVVEMFHRQGLRAPRHQASNIMLDAYGKPVRSQFWCVSLRGGSPVGAFDGFSVL